MLRTNTFHTHHWLDTKVKRSVHLPHISLRRWAGIGPWMSTTSPPYLSCNFRLFNSFHNNMMVVWSCEFQMIMMVWRSDAEKEFLFLKTAVIHFIYCIRPFVRLWYIYGKWRIPDICVKLLVQRFHLGIQGHHLFLKVSCLISGGITRSCFFYGSRGTPLDMTSLEGAKSYHHLSR